MRRLLIKSNLWYERQDELVRLLFIIGYFSITMYLDSLHKSNWWFIISSAILVTWRVVCKIIVEWENMWETEKEIPIKVTAYKIRCNYWEPNSGRKWVKNRIIVQTSTYNFWLLATPKIQSYKIYQSTFNELKRANILEEINLKMEKRIHPHINSQVINAYMKEHKNLEWFTAIKQQKELI